MALEDEKTGQDQWRGRVGGAGGEQRSVVQSVELERAQGVTGTRLLETNLIVFQPLQPMSP